MSPIAGRITISIVNYTNTLPFRWALQRSELLQQIDLQEDVPSICAAKLRRREVQLALVPVALIPELNSHHFVSNLCIGADGIVDSVKLYHDVAVDEVQTVLLDYQSRTSVNLAKVLFKHLWKKNVTYINATPGFENNVSGTTAAVVIGDRTFNLNGRFRHETDLAQAWKEMSRLPFVFAAWLSTEKLPAPFVAEFEAVLTHGVKNIRQAVADDYKGISPSPEEIVKYLEERIDYRLDEKKLQAMAQFHRCLSAL